MSLPLVLGADSTTSTVLSVWAAMPCAWAAKGAKARVANTLAHSGDRANKVVCDRRAHATGAAMRREKIRDIKRS